MSGDSIARQLANLVAGTSYADLDDATVVSTKARVLDSLGITFAAVNRPAFGAVKRFLAMSGRVPATVGDGPATVADVMPDRGASINATTHGFLFGSAAFIDNYGDTSLYSVVHPNTVVVPAALAAARATPTTGEQFLTAIVTGYQISEVLGRSLNNGVPRMAHQVRGFRPTASCGPAGAAATFGGISNLAENQLLQAIALACNLAGGLRRTDAGEFAHMRIHSGEATSRGIEAVYLAQAGIRVDEDFIEGAGGFYGAMRGGELDNVPIAPTDARDWFINDVAMKLHATPHTLASGLDCLLQLARERSDAFSAIESVQIFLPAAHAAISLSAAQLDVASLSATEALDSFPLCAAVALRTGDVLFPGTIERYIGDPLVLALARRIVVSADSEQSKIFEQERGSWPVRVEIRIDGETLTLRRRLPRGVELDTDVLVDLRRKFDVLCEQALAADGRAELADLIFGLEQSTDVYADLCKVIST